ncbi:rod shape-determining protein MreD [Marivivens niveibacter]|uniref:Rod shape-determining protein MreD n=2 Tax=Marivivens niveibacter TaxID=1930667 RepID=A0A251WUN7_9RHOB|nr:rod shape-determining protein MreD [Marivivens niveibacter]
MNEIQTTRRWLGRVMFVVISYIILFAQLMPLSTEPSQWAPPDILMLITMAWVVRRPDLAPIGLIALIHFSADLLLLRPPGLWTVLVIISTEILRAKSSEFRSLAFPFEWISVAGTLIALFFAHRIVLMIMFLPQAPIMLTLSQLLMTILAYPLVTFLSYVAFGVSRPALGEVDDRGRRL